jgi:hypothetical protein
LPHDDFASPGTACVTQVTEDGERKRQYGCDTCAKFTKETKEEVQ